MVLDTQPRGELPERHSRGTLFATLERFPDFAGSELLREQEIEFVPQNRTEADGFVLQLLQTEFDHTAGILAAAAVAAAPVGLCSSIGSVGFGRGFVVEPALLHATGTGIQFGSGRQKALITAFMDRWKNLRTGNLSTPNREWNALP